MGKKLLVTTPFLDNIGGTEIEAVLTALHFYDNHEYEKVAIFSPSKCNAVLFEDLIENRDISFLHFPAFFNSKRVLFVNKILKKLGIKISIFEFVYWFFISKRFTHFFVLTYPGCIYFFPLFQFYDKRKKYVAKVTMWHHYLLCSSHRDMYMKFNTILVFNEKQKVFWEQNNFLQNVKALDVMILNEANLISLQEKTLNNNSVSFGYLGRVAREKKIEDMILLLDFLNNKNYKKCKLVIQGKGNLDYLNELRSLVQKHKLTEFIIFKTDFISPNQTHDFYSSIDVFLVTSKNEAGPMTSLEAVAAGCFVMGYDIGAMKDRFNQFPYVVNSDFNSLCDSVIAFLNLTTFEKNKILKELRDYYILNLSNVTKGNQLNKILD